MRGWARETNRTALHKLRRSAGVALATLLFLLLTVSPSRGTCPNLMLTFANVPDQRTLHVRPNGVVSIVGEYWTDDCFDTGAEAVPAMAPATSARSKTSSSSSYARTGRTRSLSPRISAEGEDESWFLTFRVPDVPPGNYFINAKERGSTGGGTRLSLSVSPDAST